MDGTLKAGGANVGNGRRERTTIDDGEAGASLMLTLACVLVASVLVASLTAYAQVSNRVVTDYRAQRNERYAGEGAIDAAVNWASTNPNVALDPAQSTPDLCNYQVSTPANGIVTVSCGAEPGSGSGIDDEAGLKPAEAILTLGRRHNQSPAFNSADCAGWATPIIDGLNWIVSGGNMSQEAQDRTKWGETSIKLKRRTGVGTNLFGILPGATCNVDYNRGNPANVSFDVQGKVIAAGQIATDYGTLRPVDAENNVLTTSDWIKARDQVGSSPYGIPGTRPADRDAGGTPEDSDPARIIKSAGNNAPATNAIGDLRSEWFPVGYSPTGTNANVLTDRNGNPLPERTHAYVLDPATGNLTPATVGGVRSCVEPRSNPIVFLPGWYRSSAVVNDYLGSTASGCRDRTFWFAPDAARTVGGQLKIVLDDTPTNPDRTVTGAYYFDFRNSAGSQACGDLPAANPSGSGSLVNADSAKYRMCIGNSASQSPRVVAGWPKDWSPYGTGAVDPDTGSGASVLDVLLSNPNVDKARWTVVGQIGGDQLGDWQNLQAASVAGGGAASWSPTCLPLIGCLWFFGERSLTFNSFSPEVLTAPIELAGAENGRVYVNFRYAFTNGDRLPNTKLEVRAKALGVADKLCTTVDLPKTGHNYSAAFNTGSMGDAFTFRLPDANAKEVADNCGTVDQLNGLFVHFKVGGSLINWSGAKPVVYLDGVTADYKGFGGASFPSPVTPGGTESSEVAAKSDCDPTKPGAQFILGGASHIYVADGSLEICAGPYPTDTADHQQIGVYQLPAVAPIRGTVGSTTGSNVSAPIAGTTNSNARVIGEPTGISSYRFQWGEATEWWNIFTCCYEVHEAATPVVMDQYTPPAGYQIKRIEARVAYNPYARNNVLSLVSAGAEASQLRTPRTGSGSNPHVGVGALWSNTLSVQNSTSLLLYERGSSTVPTKLDPADLAGAASARTLTWVARRPCPKGSWSGLWEGFLGLFDGRACPSWNELDGIELDITLEPTAANSGKPMLLPASGCTNAYPNYGVGAGLPDCAAIRSNANVAGQLPSSIFSGTTQAATWNGRFSVKGTIYTPSSAVEIDDIDYAYPAATRGMVVRHLRLSGWVRRPSYTGPAVSDGWVEPKAVPREATFVACVQSESRRTAKAVCDAAEGDQILTKANVDFEVDADLNTASVAKVRWWSTER